MALLKKSGRITMLRAHRRGSAFGPPQDEIDVEVVVKLDSEPNEAYGLPLRDNADGPANRAMFDLLQAAFEAGRVIELEVEIDQGKRNGLILRVIAKPSKRTVVGPGIGGGVIGVGVGVLQPPSP